MKKLLIGLMIGCLSVISLAGCTNTSKTEERYYTNDLMNQADDIVGNPNIKNFYEKAQLKEIYEMRDDPNLICYWYTSNIEGEYIYQGKCIGYGIPYSTSYTQPESYEYQGCATPQADPNALYSNGVTTSATWVLAIDEDGTERPRYVEQEITVSQTKLDKRLCKKSSLPEDY